MELVFSWNHIKFQAHLCFCHFCQACLFFNLLCLLFQRWKRCFCCDLGGGSRSPSKGTYACRHIPKRISRISNAKSRPDLGARRHDGGHAPFLGWNRLLGFRRLVRNRLLYRLLYCLSPLAGCPYFRERLRLRLLRLRRLW